MRWPPWSSRSHCSPGNNDESEDRQQTSTTTTNTLNSFTWASFTSPQTLIATAILTSAILSAARFHRRYLRRFPDATSIPTTYFRRRSIFGKVTSVGDGDNFRIFHTPGGRLAGWGWLPWKRVPTLKKELRNNTIHIRLAGVDAPELAHFGHPEQPFAREAHEWLTSFLLNKRVRAYVHRPDQYQRAVATVYVRRAFDFPIPFRRRDVSYEMLSRGLATVYEAKSGSEFGGKAKEKEYRNAEWWAKTKRSGLWKGFRNNKEWESPREYKTRMGAEGQVNGKDGKK
ncbi:nuclease domain protein [Aspergillus granulosus]|uniref:Probable endonuclease LCL3 n=1 Tax=Aspergillus granulosus TaxID=176169 RepID=A0ABR4GY45_9EURO